MVFKGGKERILKHMELSKSPKNTCFLLSADAASICFGSLHLRKDQMQWMVTKCRFLVICVSFRHLVDLCEEQEGGLYGPLACSSRGFLIFLIRALNAEESLF